MSPVARDTPAGCGPSHWTQIRARLALSPMRALCLLLCLVLPTLSQADDWDALRTEGAFAVMRHALAPGTGDPAGFRLDDCATQRNLDERGREQARATGAAFRAREIRFDHVLTSQWCRSRETAELMELGPVTEEPALNSFFGNRATEAEQTRAILEILEGLDGRAMLVTHQVNVTALTGVYPSSGEIVVARLAGDRVEVLGRIEIAP